MHALTNLALESQKDMEHSCNTMPIGMTSPKRDTDPQDARVIPSCRYRRLNPRDHQCAAIHDIVNGFMEHDRGQLIMPCATGKTLVGIEVARQLQSRSIVVLAPTIILLTQLLQEWSVNMSEFQYLCVCSDDTIDRENRRIAQEILSVLQQVTTDPQAIRIFLQTPAPLKIVFATCQSFPLVKMACESISLSRHFDLAVADEAHHCAGWVGRPFSAILDEKVRIANRLFMTATPRYITASKNGSLLKILSMDDNESFGPVLHKLSFSRALEQNLLSDYRIAVIAVHPDFYREELNAAAKIRPSADDDTNIFRYQACHIALADAMRQCDLRNVISYHNRVSAAKKFSRDFSEYVTLLPENKRPTRPIWSEYISGDMEPRLRNGKLLEFGTHNSHATNLLCNARCLTEGIDVPAIDGIIFVDPRKSIIDITQCVGRALRKTDTAKIATIVIPVFMRDDDNATLPVYNSQYRAVWNVLQALGSIDDAMAQQLEDLQRYAGRDGWEKSRLPQKVHQVNFSTIDQRLVDSLNIKIFKHSTATWDFMYGLLEKFSQREGNGQVPERHIEDGYHLGIWVRHQRRLHKQQKISERQAKLLEKIPGWAWQLRSSYFDRGISHYERFLATYKNANIPRSLIDSDGFRLGEWLNDQKRRYRQHKLTPEQISRLGDTLEWLKSYQTYSAEEKWLQWYMRILRFESENGHGKVPWKYRDSNNFPLGRWVIVQKQQFRRGKLSKNRQLLLSRVSGWEWEVYDSKWMEHLNQLKKFILREGHCKVPKNHLEDGYLLRNWCAHQKRRWREGRLSLRKIRMLEGVQGWVWSKRHYCQNAPSILFKS